MTRTFRIRQLESPLRVLTLTDRAVPLQGFRFELEIRGENRWQVGSEEGEPLISGVELPETDFEFRWRQQTIGAGADLDGSRIETVEGVLDAVESMARDLVLVVVEWERWARVGWIQSVGYPIERPHEFTVDLTVQWVKLNEQEQRKRPKPAPDFTQTQISISDRWATALRQIRRPLALAEQAQRDTEESVSRVSRSLSDVDRVLRRYRDSAATTVSTAGRMAEAMGSMVAEGATLRDIAGRPPHDVAPVDDPTTRIAVDSYRARVGRAGARLRHDAAYARRRLLNEARPDVLRRHVAFEHEDLRLLAWRTYGRIDAWQDVAAFNELGGSILRAGQSVLLPRLEAGAL